MRIAELPGRERRDWLQTISALAGDRTYPPPAAFDPNTPADLAANPACIELLNRPDWPPAGPTVDVWLGEPVEITSATVATFERYPGSNLLIVGDEQAAHGMMLAELLSIAAQRSPADAAFIVAEFARSTSPFQGFFTQLQVLLPHSLQIIGHRTAAAGLEELVHILGTRNADASKTDPELFLLIAGLHRWRELAPAVSYERSPIAARITQLADEGPELGIHITAWSDSYATLERTLQRGGLNAFDLRAVLRVSESDSMALLGTPMAAKLPDNRALFRVDYKWESGRVEKFKPYAMPTLDTFAQLARRDHQPHIQQSKEIST